MKTCPNCGKQHDNSQQQCSQCGTSLPTSNSASGNGKHLHCPHCGSRNLQPIVESTTTGGTAVHSRATRNIGVSSYTANTVHRNYWLCHDCGHKFRNLQNLKEEIAQTKKQQTLMKIFLITFAVLSAYILLLILSDPRGALFASFLLALCGISALLFLCMWLSARSKVTKMLQEETFLEANCFN